MDRKKAAIKARDIILDTSKDHVDVWEALERLANDIYAEGFNDEGGSEDAGNEG